MDVIEGESQIISRISTEKSLNALFILWQWTLFVRVSFTHYTHHCQRLALKSASHIMVYSTFTDDKWIEFCISNHLKSFSEDDTDYVAQPKPSTYSFLSWKLFILFSVMFIVTRDCFGSPEMGEIERLCGLLHCKWHAAFKSQSGR